MFERNADANRNRLFELAMSMASLRRWLLPSIEAELVVYVNEQSDLPLRKLLRVLGLKGRTVRMDLRKSDIEFAQSLRTFAPVDRICIRRALADVDELDGSRSRLLLGNDVHFWGDPTELTSFLDEGAGVLYAIDDVTFGEPYRLRYAVDHLPGFLGDFYVLSAGVTMPAEALRSAAAAVDSWPTDRWDHIHPVFEPPIHAGDQMALAVVLSDYESAALPTDRYCHRDPGPRAIVGHVKPAAQWSSPRLLLPLLPFFVMMRIAREPCSTLRNGQLRDGVDAAVAKPLCAPGRWLKGRVMNRSGGTTGRQRTRRGL